MTDHAAGANGPATIEAIQESLRQTAALMAELREQSKETDRRMQETDRQQRETDRRMQETDRQQRETDRRMQETDRRMQETDRRMQETDRRMQETDRRMQETAEQMKETDRRLAKAEGLFTSQWGKLMESLVDGDLVPLLNERGIEVETTHQRRRGRRNGEHFEIDIVAVNGREVVVVEVKTTLKSEDVTKFLGKLPVFPDFCKEYRGRRIFGAVAYLESDPSVTAYAERRGLFVIRATGSSASIVNPPEFRPRAFG